MAVPKTAVYEDRRLVFRKGNVGATGKPDGVLPEAISPFMEIGSHLFLYGRVFAMDLGHEPAALFRR